MKQKSKKQKVVENKKVAVDNSASPNEGIILHAGTSRNELIMTEKERGVKKKAKRGLPPFYYDENKSKARRFYCR
ncbi:MAG: hypothetical protein NC927_01010 [Candidatus Omnitrophica bacterium]|nr:hypothetical protein [Candidatus Omnitrophota bacterium]